MDFTTIIRDSEKRLNKLKILINFFDQSQIIAIHVRTKVIHDIFFSNKTLDTSKLELFHLQYTDSLLDLLVKLKKNIEQKYLLLTNEIQINNDLINTFESEIQKDNFSDRVKTHTLIMQCFIQSLYQVLAFDDKSNSNMSFKEKEDLANEMGIEFYRKIGLNEYEQLNKISCDAVYEYSGLRIEKKLLGKLNIQKFKFKFQCGFQFNNQFIEVYEFIHTNEHFIYFKEKNEFLSINLNDFKHIDFSKNNSNKKEIVLQLKRKNIDLNTKAEQTLKSIPYDVETILKNYYDKISSLEFLDDLQSIDEQTNVLRTMLNINIK